MGLESGGFEKRESAHQGARERKMYRDMSVMASARSCVRRKVLWKRRLSRALADAQRESTVGAYRIQRALTSVMYARYLLHDGDKVVALLPGILVRHLMDGWQADAELHPFVALTRETPRRR